MTDTKHTPTPWQIEGECGWISTMHPFPIFAIEGIVGSREQHIADAAHIVKCVNMHDELVEALDRISKVHRGSVSDDTLTSSVNRLNAVINIAIETLKKAGAL